MPEQPPKISKIGNFEVFQSKSSDTNILVHAVLRCLVFEQFT